MKALDRKLLRDLRLMWSQALTIALVVASGVGGFITTLSAVDSLALARDRFYAEGASPTCSPPSSARRWRWPPRCARCPAWPTCRPRVEQMCASSCRRQRPDPRPADRHRPARRRA
jgi:hypothetical protein